MSIKTCVYELIRIELSCGDMREIIFSQDFLQYMMCQSVFEKCFPQDACHNLWEILPG